MTFVCFGIAKVQCEKLNLNEYFFSISYMPMYVLFKKKLKNQEKYKNSVCYVYIGTCVPWMAIETKFSKLCIIYSLDEHLYAQLSK